MISRAGRLSAMKNTQTRFAGLSNRRCRQLDPGSSRGEHLHDKRAGAPDPLRDEDLLTRGSHLFKIAWPERP
jgi:hypothetical protein